MSVSESSPPATPQPANDIKFSELGTSEPSDDDDLEEGDLEFPRGVAEERHSLEMDKLLSRLAGSFCRSDQWDTLLLQVRMRYSIRLSGLYELGNGPNSGECRGRLLIVQTSAGSVTMLDSGL